MCDITSMQDGGAAAQGPFAANSYCFTANRVTNRKESFTLNAFVADQHHGMQVIGDLVDGDGSIIQINDKKLAATLRLKLKFKDTQMLDANGTS